MKNDRKERLLRDLERRLDRLSCLAWATKHEVKEHAHGHLTASKLAAYLEDRLWFLERWVAPVDHPGFLKVCRELGPIRTKDGLQRRVGLGMQNAPEWLRSADRFHNDLPRMLFCVANAVALRFTSPAAEEEVIELGMITFALRSVGRSGTAITLLEGYLGLTGEMYADPVRLGEHLWKRTKGLVPNHVASLVFTLADALMLGVRSGDAVALLEGYLGLTGEMYADSARLSAHVREMAANLGTKTPASLVRVLADALMLVYRSGDAVVLLEGYLGLTGEMYADPVRLGEHLQEMTANLGTDATAGLVRPLADALRLGGRSGAAMTLLEGYWGLTGEMYADPVRLGEHLRKRTQMLDPDNAVELVVPLSEALGRVVGWGAVVTLLRVYLGLTGELEADPVRLSEHLREMNDRLQAENVPVLVTCLATAMKSTGQTGESARLLDAYFTTFRPLDDIHGPSPWTLVLLLQDWFLCFAVADPQRAQETARKVIPYLRRSIRRPGMSLDDCKRFLQRIRGLRLMLVVLAHCWAEDAADAEDVRRWRLTAQLWDAELGQRVLLERFLLGRILHAGDDGASEPAPRWPFTGSEETDAERPDALPTLAAFDAIADGGEALQAPPAQPLGTVSAHPSWPDEAEQRVRQGLDEPALAGALGPGTLLLRLSISALDGRLLWTATRSDRERLEVVAHGLGQPGDQYRLAWAVARHDLRIALAYLSHDVVQELLDKLRNAYGGGGLLTPERDEDLLSDDTVDLAAKLKRLHKGFGCQFEAVCAPLMVPGPDLASQWRATLDALVRTAERPVRDVATLNTATAEYLEEVECVCDLGTLAGHLGSGLDVVVQADDVLHAVPVAHLEVAGRPLWQRVRSVRASLSVLLDVLQRQIEQERRNDVPVSRRLLTVSWVRPGDAVHHATQRLHREQRSLASPERFGLEWLGAAEDPRATPGTLFRGIDGGPLRALTVCGHGDEQQAGVRLAGADQGDSLWSGQGRDLSGVEWLLLVSCSVGRVRGSSTRDVEGLCVELALHRCRSVLAAKWPIEGLQAAAVAGRVLGEYLELRREFDDGQLGPDLSDARLRSLALNRARTGLGPRYLNTLAAFELYGLA